MTWNRKFYYSYILGLVIIILSTCQITPGLADSIPGQTLYLPLVLKMEPVEQVIFQYSNTVDNNQYIGNSLYIINSDGSNFTKIANNIQTNRSLELSPDGKKLSFVTDIRYPSGLTAPDIFIMNIDGSGLVNLTNNISEDDRNVWVLDSKSILFTSWRTGDFRLYEIEIGSYNLQQLTPIPNSLGCCSWSTDRNRVVLYENKGSPVGLFVMYRDGSGLKRLVDTYYTNRHAVWSPTDLKIAFEQTFFDNRDIFTISPDGNDMKNISNSPESERILDWSPDGNKLLIATLRDGKFGMFSVNSDGSDLFRLTDPSISISPTKASWSPSGRKIAFLCSNGVNICTVNADGTDIRQMTNFTDGIISFIEWKPNQ